MLVFTQRGRKGLQLKLERTTKPTLTEPWIDFMDTPYNNEFTFHFLFTKLPFHKKKNNIKCIYKIKSILTANCTRTAPEVRSKARVGVTPSGSYVPVETQPSTAMDT